MKGLRIAAAFAVLAALSLACAVGTPTAQINCTGTGQQYECTVTHTMGGEGEVCWDLQVTCANASVQTAHACVDIGPGQTVNHTIPISSFPNWSACDTVSTVAVVNTTSTAN